MCGLHIKFLLHKMEVGNSSTTHNAFKSGQTVYYVFVSLNADQPSMHVTFSWISSWISFLSSKVIFLKR